MWQGYDKNPDSAAKTQITDKFLVILRKEGTLQNAILTVERFTSRPNGNLLLSRVEPNLELSALIMKECVWLRPEAVTQVEFLEWTQADRLRHSKFVGLRDDKNPSDVTKEDKS